MPKQKYTDVDVTFGLTLPKMTDAQAKKVMRHLISTIENELENMDSLIIPEECDLPENLLEDWGYSYGFDIKSIKVTQK